MSNDLKHLKNRGHFLTALLTVCLAGVIQPAFPERAGRSSDAEPSADSFDTLIYGQILERFVDERGVVDYRGLKQHRSGLDEFVNSLGDLKQAAFEQFAEEEKIAFWLNAYNALTLKAVIDHYPIQAGFLKSWVYPKNSIRQIPGVWDSIRFPVLGREVTLNEIEHEILRKQFHEPRIHLALVCASIGCPPLRAEPYHGSELDAQLDDQARRFLADPEKFRIDRRSGQVDLSAIFNWFKADFTLGYRPESGFARQPEEDRPVLNFISGYLGPSGAEYLKDGEYEIEYFEYDWSLNER